MSAAVIDAEFAWKPTLLRLPAVRPVLTARLTARGSGGTSPGRSSTAAANAQESIALCNSVLVTNSRPTSTTNPRNPTSTASDRATKIATPPLWSERMDVETIDFPGAYRVGNPLPLRMVNVGGGASNDL